MASRRKLKAKQKRRQKLARRDGPGCLVCRWNEGLLTIHHIKKKADGGSNDLRNLCLLCEDCHVYWHKHETDDFYKWVEDTKDYLYVFGVDVDGDED